MNGGTDDGGSIAAEAAAMARGLAAQARDVAEGIAGDIADRLPGAATTTGDAISEAAGQAVRQMDSSSDEMLTAGAMLSLGVALGLWLGGSHRLLVATALIPAAAMGATLLDRRNRGRRAS